MDKGLKLCQRVRLCLSSWERGKDTFVNLCSDFRQIGGEQGAFLIWAHFQLPSAQNKPYAELTYVGVAYSATLQKWLRVQQTYTTAPAHLGRVLMERMVEHHVHCLSPLKTCL